jgi:pimeloyl-ACP methyl ester carboxylesterase
VTPLHVFYLHGFASSPHGGKAHLLAERFALHGVALHAPDLNEPAFETLTVSRMIGQVEAAMAVLPPGPVALIGSSLGGLVAWHVAARAEADAGRRRVDRLVLLAPALTFNEASFDDLLGAGGMQRWRDTGRLDLMHYGYGEPRTLRYAIVPDAARYDAEAAGVTVPVLIFQGRRDDLVDAAMVEAFAAARSNVRLRLFDDDHRLHDSLPAIWRETASFLGLSDRA